MCEVPMAASYVYVDHQWLPVGDSRMVSDYQRREPQFPPRSLVQPLSVSSLKTEPGKERKDSQALQLDPAGYRGFSGYGSILGNGQPKGMGGMEHPGGFDRSGMPLYMYRRMLANVRPNINADRDGLLSMQWGADIPSSKRIKRNNQRPGQSPHSTSVPQLVTSDEETSPSASRSLTRSQSPEERQLKTDDRNKKCVQGAALLKIQPRTPGLVVKPEAVHPEWKPFDMFVNSNGVFDQGQRSRSRIQLKTNTKMTRGKTKTGWRHWTQPENVKLWELTAVYRSKRRYVQWKEVQRQYNAWTSENDYPTRSSKSLTTHYNDQLKKRKYRDRRGIIQP